MCYGQDAEDYVGEGLRKSDRGLEGAYGEDVLAGLDGCLVCVGKGSVG